MQLLFSGVGVRGGWWGGGGGVEELGGGGGGVRVWEWGGGGVGWFIGESSWMAIS